MIRCFVFLMLCFLSCKIQAQDTSVKIFVKGNKEQRIQGEREWNKFKKFKGNLDKNISDQKVYLNQIHSYSKDSLQILEVKLLSILELEHMELLGIDISNHTNYYISILELLKLSKIDPSEYSFFENKLTLQVLNKSKEKYRRSICLNLVLAALVLYLIFYIYRIHRKEKAPSFVSLSKQEIKIKNCIIEGKTNKEIADELFISLSTVKTHITNMYKKLQVKKREDFLLKIKK